MKTIVTVNINFKNKAEIVDKKIGGFEIDMGYGIIEEFVTAIKQACEEAKVKDALPDETEVLKPFLQDNPQ